MWNVDDAGRCVTMSAAVAVPVPGCDLGTYRSASRHLQSGCDIICHPLPIPTDLDGRPAAVTDHARDGGFVMFGKLVKHNEKKSSGPKMDPWETPMDLFFIVDFGP